MKLQNVNSKTIVNGTRHMSYDKNMIKHALKQKCIAFLFNSRKYNNIDTITALIGAQ